MSRIRTYTTYTEVTNGLFVDIKEISIKITDINNTSDGEVIINSSLEGLRQFNRVMQEAAYIQTIDMSERETIQYLDRISQEQENEQHNSTI